MRMILAILAAAGLLLSGCAPLGVGGGGDEAARLDVELRRFQDQSGTTHYVQLDPLRVGRTPTLDAGSVTLAMGALYVSRPDGPESFHTLALVLTTVNPEDDPLLEDDQQLLLDIDGTRLESSPGPRGHTYRTESTAPGLEETVMVPLSPEQMRALADARVVRGRLGPWFSFVLPTPHRRALRALLDELPDGVGFNEAPRTGVPTLIAES